MAIASGTHWSLDASATASNVNGGGFNINNANFITDYAATSATGDSPVLTSATYSFVAGDDESWVYVQSGTNWTPGFYQIASVSGGAATLRAAVGESVQFINERWQSNTTAGCATTASPTGGVVGIDYSQGTAAIATATDLACADGDAAAPTITSASAPFGLNHAGNLIRIRAGTGYTTNWYEIVSVSVVTATLDRACGSDGAKTNGTFNLGGAMSMNSSVDDALFEAASTAGGNYFWVKNGSYTTGQSISIANAGVLALFHTIEGFNSIRGDAPTGSSRPSIACAANNFGFNGGFWKFKYLIVTGTSATFFSNGGSSHQYLHIKSTNASTTAARTAFNPASGDQMFVACEGIAYRGRGITLSSSDTSFISCWFHDSDIGAANTSPASSNPFFRDCIFSSNVSAAYSTTGAAQSARTFLLNCTFYGSENTTGTGIIMFTGSADYTLMNSIIYGFATAITQPDAGNNANFDYYNDFYNNDDNTPANWSIGVGSISVDPDFTNVGQVAGTTAVFTAGNDRIVDTTKDFTALGVVANQDHIYIVSGTGATAGIYGITAIATTTNANDTLVLTPAPGTNTTGDKVYQITTGQNFLPTGAV